MHIIGLAGAARSGKDTVAKHLNKAHGYKVFSFSDALYREVAEAFGVAEHFLRDARTKEQPTTLLSLQRLGMEYNRFCQVAGNKLLETEGKNGRSYGCHEYAHPCSPRWILQTWGTEYRRAENPRYWLDCATDWLLTEMANAKVEAPWLRFVNTSVRYPNEAEWIRELGGEVWHIRRNDRIPIDDTAKAHSSEVPLVVEQNDTVLYNNGSIDSLWTTVTMKLSQPNAKEIHIEAEEAEDE